MDFELLVNELKNLYSQIGSYAYYIFGLKYAQELNDVNISQLIKSAGLTESMAKEIGKAKRVAELIQSGEYDICFANSSDKNTVFHKNNDENPLQQIFYGAPGTGKSFGTDGEIHKIYPKKSEEEKKYVFRTTFHPDSDYSTFVGCYKPTKEGKENKSRSLLGKDELVAKLKEYRTLYDETMAQTQFGYDYYEELRRSTELADIIKEAGVKTFDTAIRIGMSLAERCTPKARQSSITYAFTPQAFTKAYIAAWESVLKGENKPVFLVIEEINRGNCAQIFGDIFQLLDRNENGRSSYPIKPDTDLGIFIGEQLGNLADENPDLRSIAMGEEMLLPENLHIRATMNTSDQSLFPIDSAFKRRWDWKYVPIDYDKETWSIEAKGVQYSWSDFLKKMNGLVASTTDSEDKMLGFYFAKAKNGIIDADTFVGKVVFYLWNDVFKDYGLPKEILNGAESKEFAFRNFFMVDGHANEDMVKRLLDNLGVAKDSDIPTEENVSTEDIENNTVGGKRDTSRYRINGSGNYPKTDLATEVMKVYVTNHPGMSVNDIISEWTSLNVAITDIVTDEATHDSKKLKTSDPRFDNRTGKVTVGNEALFVTRCWAIENVSEFIEKVNARSWGIHIENA